MKITLQKKFLTIFFFINVVVLFANATQNFVLDIIFKPLIVVSLLIYLFIQNAHKGKAVVFALGGLFLSLVGDVLLIFHEQLFFMLGLICFLIAHLLYIFYYICSSEFVSTKKLKNKTIFILLIIVYGILFCSFLNDHLGVLKVPVFVYTSVLISMNIFALNRYGKVNDKSFKLIVIGALCFALSDSLLALNKFIIPIPLAGIWIIAAYSAAQYFITQGVLSTATINN